MSYNNPFPYSDDNKRYHTWNYYLKHRFQQKVFKVALNANFSCPNRDGTCGVGGCTFCGSMGSGEYAGNIHEDLQLQFAHGTKRMHEKWPQGLAMPYFQAYSNTYAPLDVLKQTFDPFIAMEKVPAISIATRADCLDPENVAYLDSLCDHKEVWLELGLQSIHDETARHIHRGHDTACFLNALALLRNTRLKLCVHIINALPYETKDRMLETASAIANMPVQAIKIHMLHIMKGTQLANEYTTSPFPLLSRDAYVDIVIRQLELLPPHMIIQRLTGDGVKEQLIAPLWTLKKVVVLNEIDKEMKRRDTWQGKYYQACE